MVAIVPQHVFQCIFDEATLPMKAIEPIPFGSPRRHAVHSPPRRKRCTTPHNIFQCSFDEMLLPPDVEALAASEAPELHGVHITPLVKRCSKCKETKSVDQFTKKRSSKDGLGSWCKQCKSMSDYERRERLRNARKLEYLNSLSAEELEMRKTHKRCSKCQMWLPKSNFGANRRCRDGLFSWCYSCCAKNNARYRTPERTKNSKLRHIYGMTREQYDAMLAEQGFVCACCKQSEKHTNQWGKVPLAVDHDHRSGLVRALLCHECNTAYGLLREDEGRILALLEYHRQHQNGEPSAKSLQLPLWSE